MRKIFFVNLLLFSICGNNYAQQGRNAPLDGGLHCPPGMCVTSVSFTFDYFNFHKPRTNCKSGFGVCIGGQWSFSCGYPPGCLGNVSYKSQVAKMEDGKVHGWFQFVEGKLELHLPVALEETGTNEDKDFSVFSLDPGMISLKNDRGVIVGKLKGGDYPVKRSDTEFIIAIDIQ